MKYNISSINVIGGERVKTDKLITTLMYRS